MFWFLEKQKRADMMLVSVLRKGRSSLAKVTAPSVSPVAVSPAGKSLLHHWQLSTGRFIWMWLQQSNVKNVFFSQREVK